MANLILSEADKLFLVEGFRGIDRRVSGGAYTCRNFRILPGGSLEKREGFSPVTTLPGIPRAAWCGNVFGEEMLFCLVDNVVYSVSCEDEGYKELGSVSTVDGKADFFYCRGGLYLVDGMDIYSVSEDGVESAGGYVPVYGRDWEGIAPGTVNEPINLLSDRVIIHFKLMNESITFTFLELGIKCSEILGVTLNGAEYSGVATLESSGTRIKLTGTLPSECEMCFLLRLDGSLYRRSELKGVTRAAACGGDGDSRVLLFGGNDGSRVFALREVDESSTAMSRSMASDSDEMYFPVTDTVMLGDGRESVTAAVPFGDRMMIFTETGAWVGDFSGKSTPTITRISNGVGCLAPRGAVTGRYAYSVTRNGIFKWDSVKSSLDTSAVQCISGPISELLSAGFCRGAVSYYSPIYGEIWFADPDSDNKTVFVYCEENGTWYTFDGIPADELFTVDGRAAFLSGKYLLGFTKSGTADIVVGDMEKTGKIEAEYVSQDIDFDLPGRPKRIRRVMSEADADGDSFNIAVCGDRMKKPAVAKVVSCDGGRGITYSDHRVNTGRFDRMHFEIAASGCGRVRIDKISFSVFT